VTNPVTLLFFYTAMSTFLRQAANVVRAPSPHRSHKIYLSPDLQARQASSKRAFASSTVSRKGMSFIVDEPVPPLIPNTPADLVQDLYLREVKAYKPIPTVSNLQPPKTSQETKELWTHVIIFWFPLG